jgi:hypothetical protein
MTGSCFSAVAARMSRRSASVVSGKLENCTEEISKWVTLARRFACVSVSVITGVDEKGGRGLPPEERLYDSVGVFGGAGGSDGSPELGS